MTADDITYYIVPVKDLTNGQVLRNRWANVSYVVRNVNPGSVVTTFDMVNPDGLATSLTFPTAGSLSTWLHSDLALAPGLDGESMRCLTCDSRHCGNVCLEPWLMDRA